MSGWHFGWLPSSVAAYRESRVRPLPAGRFPSAIILAAFVGLGPMLAPLRLQ